MHRHVCKGLSLFFKERQKEVFYIHKFTNNHNNNKSKNYSQKGKQQINKKKKKSWLKQQPIYLTGKWEKKKFKAFS